MNEDEEMLGRARLAIETAARGHLFDPNVTMIGFGFKETGGKLQEDRFAIRFHVRQKLSLFELETASTKILTRPIPARMGEFETDVIQSRFSPHGWGWAGGRPAGKTAREIRQEVLRGGVSISTERQVGRGTLGGLVADRETGDRMILSNWHVLVGDWGASAGLRVFQPGRMDGGTGRDTVARLSRDAMADRLDAAVARLTGDRMMINDQYGAGPVTGAGVCLLGQEVLKSGCQTAVTSGRVTEVDAMLRMSYAGLTRIIRKVAVIEPRMPLDVVSSGGDSGSWWLDAASRRAVGLHFAGSNTPERALAMDMTSVLDALRVDIVTAGS